MDGLWLRVVGWLTRFLEGLFVQPTNEDKEPIRHLYRRYHEVKEALAELEAEVLEGGGWWLAACRCR